LFEALQNELAIALEARHWQLAGGPAGRVDIPTGQLQRIVSLRRAIAAVEGALDRRESGIIH
jgi:hypothetical protein